MSATVTTVPTTPSVVPPAKQPRKPKTTAAAPVPAVAAAPAPVAAPAPAPAVVAAAPAPSAAPVAETKTPRFKKAKTDVVATPAVAVAAAATAPAAAAPAAVSAPDQPKKRGGSKKRTETELEGGQTAQPPTKRVKKTVEAQPAAVVPPVELKDITKPVGAVTVDTVSDALDVIIQNIQSCQTGSALSKKIGSKIVSNCTTVQSMVKKLSKQKKVKQPPRDNSKASGFNSLNFVTPEMESFMGVPADTKVARSAITNKLSSFITEQKLKQENSGGIINVKGNAVFEKLFPGRETIAGHTELQKLINNHIVVKMKSEVFGKFVGVKVGDRVLKQSLRDFVVNYCVSHNLVTSYPVVRVGGRGQKTEQVNQYTFDDTLRAAMENSTLTTLAYKNLQKQINKLVE
jgi:hypothetical protein